MVDSACSNACNSTCMERALDSCVEPDACERGCKCDEGQVSQDTLLLIYYASIVFHVINHHVKAFWQCDLDVQFYLV